MIRGKAASGSGGPEGLMKKRGPQRNPTPGSSHWTILTGKTGDRHLFQLDYAELVTDANRFRMLTQILEAKYSPLALISSALLPILDPLGRSNAQAKGGPYERSSRRFLSSRTFSCYRDRSGSQCLGGKCFFVNLPQSVNRDWIGRAKHNGLRLGATAPAEGPTPRNKHGTRQTASSSTSHGDQKPGWLLTGARQSKKSVPARFCPFPVVRA